VRISVFSHFFCRVIFASVVANIKVEINTTVF